MIRTREPSARGWVAFMIGAMRGVGAEQVRAVVRHDLPASLVVFLVAVPLSLGIAVASGAPLMAGLIAAAVGGVVVGLAGGSRLQVSGPAAGLTVVVAELVNAIGWQLTCAVTVGAGLLQILFGMSKMARIALAVSPAVMHGMLAGIGITIALAQIHVVLGGSAQTKPLENVRELPGQLADLHHPAVVIGLLVVVIMVVWPRLPAAVSRIPSPLGAVLAATVAASAFGIDAERVELPSSLVDAVALPEMPSGTWGPVLLGILTVALIASMESLLSAVAVDGMAQGSRTDLDRELIGQGAANSVSGMLGGLPVTGVIVRSSANVKAGAQTRASAVLHGLWIVVFSILLVGLVERIPMAALAGLLVVVGVQLVKLADVRLARDRGELVVYVVTVLGVLLTNLPEGVLIGLGASLLLMIRRVVGVQVRSAAAGEDRWRVVIEGTLTVLSMPRLSARLSEIPPRRHVVVELAVDHVDHAAYDQLTAWKEHYEAEGGRVLVDEVGFVPSPHRDAHRAARDAVVPRQLAPWSVWQRREHLGDSVPDRLLAGLQEYHRRTVPLLGEHVSRLADGQRPDALFLTCADSRVVPNLLTASGPGDLFTVRNVGNLVPGGGDRSVDSAVEYAVRHLEVPAILVCGHSGCGAMHALLAGVAGEPGPLGGWLAHAGGSLEAFRVGHPVGLSSAAAGRGEVDQLAMVNVARQLDLLAAHPAVREHGTRLVGLFFDISTARLEILERDRFVPVPDDVAAVPSPR